MICTLQHLEHTDGATESWVADLVCALIAANDCHRVIETGAFLGHTTVCLAQTLAALEGERELLVAEIDPARALAVDTALMEAVGSEELRWHVYAQDVMQVIAAQPDESLDAAWIDDDHQADHVTAEVQALLPKLRARGLLLFHDVYGSVALHHVVERFGGYCFDFPRLGPAGGLGAIQVR